MKKGDTSVNPGLNAVGNELSLKAPGLMGGGKGSATVNGD